MKRHIGKKLRKREGDAQKKMVEERDHCKPGWAVKGQPGNCWRKREKYRKGQRAERPGKS